MGVKHLYPIYQSDKPPYHFNNSCIYTICTETDPLLKLDFMLKLQLYQKTVLG